MSTMEQARPADVAPDAADPGAADLGAAVEEQTAKIVTELGAALRLLGFLARVLAAESVALLGAYRDTEASPQLLKIAGQAQQLALAGLTQDEVPGRGHRGRRGGGPRRASRGAA